MPVFDINTTSLLCTHTNPWIIVLLLWNTMISLTFGWLPTKLTNSTLFSPRWMPKIRLSGENLMERISPLSSMQNVMVSFSVGPLTVIPVAPPDRTANSYRFGVQWQIDESWLATWTQRVRRVIRLKGGSYLLIGVVEKHVGYLADRIKSNGITTQFQIERFFHVSVQNRTTDWLTALKMNWYGLKGLMEKHVSIALSKSFWRYRGHFFCQWVKICCVFESFRLFI